jgi:hypothetical protein
MRPSKPYESNIEAPELTYEDSQLRFSLLRKIPQEYWDKLVEVTTDITDGAVEVRHNSAIKIVSSDEVANSQTSLRVTGTELMRQLPIIAPSAQHNIATGISGARVVQTRQGAKLVELVLFKEAEGMLKKERNSSLELLGKPNHSKHTHRGIIIGQLIGETPIPRVKNKIERNSYEYGYIKLGAISLRTL